MYAWWHTKSALRTGRGRQGAVKRPLLGRNRTKHGPEVDPGRRRRRVDPLATQATSLRRGLQRDRGGNGERGRRERQGAEPGPRDHGRAYAGARWHRGPAESEDVVPAHRGPDHDGLR